VTVATIVVVVVCAAEPMTTEDEQRKRSAADTAAGGGTGLQPSAGHTLAASSASRYARREAERRLARSQAASSAAATAAVDRLARGPGLRPRPDSRRCSPATRANAHRRPSPGDIFDGASAAAAAQTPLDDDAPPNMYADSIFQHGGGGTLHQLQTTHPQSARA